MYFRECFFNFLQENLFFFLNFQWKLFLSIISSLSTEYLCHYTPFKSWTDLLILELDCLSQMIRWLNQMQNHSICGSLYYLLIVTIFAWNMAPMVFFLQFSFIFFIQSWIYPDLALMDLTVSLNLQGIAFAYIMKKLTLLNGEIGPWCL